MPDIICIAAGDGHFQHTTALERMVHYKLGTPQFFDSEQINAGSWRLVHQNPAGSTTWHPKNDNLEGVDTTYGGQSYYGSRDHNENVWSVPFNAPRPGHEANATYSYPDELFIFYFACSCRHILLSDPASDPETSDPKTWKIDIRSKGYRLTALLVTDVLPDVLSSSLLSSPLPCFSLLPETRLCSKLTRFLDGLFSL